MKNITKIQVYHSHVIYLTDVFCFIARGIFAESIIFKRKSSSGVVTSLVWLQRVVKEMNRLGMVIDLSEASHQTQLDVLSITKAPVIFSRAAANSLRNHSRNIQDDVIDLVVSSLLITFIDIDHIHEIGSQVNIVCTCGFKINNIKVNLL